MRQARISSEKTKRQAERRVRQAIKNPGATVQTTGIPADAARILKCIQHANGDVTKIQACQP